MAPLPIKFQELVQLASVGVDAQSISFNSCVCCSPFFTMLSSSLIQKTQFLLTFTILVDTRVRFVRVHQREKGRSFPTRSRHRRAQERQQCYTPTNQGRQCHHALEPSDHRPQGPVKDAADLRPRPEEEAQVVYHERRRPVLDLGQRVYPRSRHHHQRFPLGCLRRCPGGSRQGL